VQRDLRSDEEANPHTTDSKLKTDPSVEKRYM
jgi:hypothetical protein